MDETHDLQPSRPTSMLVRVLATSVVLGLVVLVFLLLHEAGPAARRWTFTESISDAAALGLRAVDESGGRWQLEDHASATGGRALVNHAGEPNARDALALATKPVARDVKVATRCKTRAGSGALACGLVLRYVDPHNHYVAAIDVAQKRVALMAVSRDEVVTVAEVRADIAPDTWHDLSVEARGDVFMISFDRKSVLTARDTTLRSAGTVGLWAPAESVSLFDELSVETLMGNLDALEIVPVVDPKNKTSG